MNSKISEIVTELKAGRFVLVTDDLDRENEADLLLPAEFVTKEKINFLINSARGLITNPISSAIAKKLSLPLMVKENESTLMTAFTVSIDAIAGTHSGISSNDRAITMKLMANPKACAEDFERPGHVFPLIAQEDGVLKRAGHTEAAIDLLRLSNLIEVAVLCETLNDSGEPLRGQELVEFANLHQIKTISVEEIKSYRRSLLKTI